MVKNVTLKKYVKIYMLRPFVHFFQRCITYIFKDMLQNMGKIIEKIDMLCELEIEQSYKKNLVPYHNGEKIRIIFYYQVASFWPSWESLYVECMNDERFDVKLVFLNETVNEMSQMLTAEKFLKEKKLAYVDGFYFDIDEFKPHIIIYQTPYDYGHRKSEHRSSRAKAKGFRIVYIPYGIEITDTEASRKAHFEQDVIKNNWRLYTFSEEMKKDYQKYSIGRYGVRALGLPRFDSLFWGMKDKKKYPLDEEILRKVKGRKIILWKVHFPKVILEKGKKRLVTPYLNEYELFSKSIKNYKDLFFIFMPHPKFFEPIEERWLGNHIQNIKKNLDKEENVYIDISDDYRNSLLNASAIIIDRSAVMVEAGAIGVPVLFMKNKDYIEPVTEAIKPLIDSYYQGTSCRDIENFLGMINKGMDIKKSQRQNAFEKCIPFFDGKCGCRVKDDLINSLLS